MHVAAALGAIFVTSLGGSEDTQFVKPHRYSTPAKAALSSTAVNRVTGGMEAGGLVDTGLGKEEYPTAGLLLTYGYGGEADAGLLTLARPIFWHPGITHWVEAGTLSSEPSFEIGAKL